MRSYAAIINDGVVGAVSPVLLESNMRKCLFTALMAVAIVGVFVCTLAGGMALYEDLGFHPSHALVGVVFFAILGAWASIAVECEESVMG